MPRFAHITLLICLLSQCSYSQETYTITQGEITETYVDEILAQYDAKSLDNPILSLTKVIHIAEELVYHSGVIRGYKNLINEHKLSSNAISQLRSALLFSAYLKTHYILDDLKQNYYDIGNIYFQYDLIEKALFNYLKSDSVPAVSHTNDIILLNKQKSRCYYMLAFFEKAQNNLLKLEQLGYSLSDWQTVLWAQQLSARVYHKNNDFDNELKTYKRSVYLTDSLNLMSEHTTAINNIAYTYKYIGELDEANAYFASILTSKSTPINAVIHQNMAILSQNKKDFNVAEEHFERALNIYTKNKDYYHEAYLLDFLAVTYYQQSDFHNAKQYNNLSIKKSKQHEIGEVYQLSYYTQSLINQGLYEYEDALTSMNRHLDIKDSLESIKNQKKNEISLQQLFLDRTEEEVNLHFISEEIKDLEIKQLQAEKTADDERFKRFEADSLFNQEKLITQHLKIKEFENLLAIQKQLLELKESDSKIKMLDEQKEKQALELKLEKIEGLQKEEDLLMAQKNSEILALEAKERQAYVQNLIYFLLGLLAVIFIVILFYLNVRKKKRQIDSQRALLAAEKEKSDALLLNILPATVAEELKEKGKSPPRHFKMTSIVFTDFAGFTQISEKLSPVELVETLDQIFLEFDLIVEQNGLNRIKTIGDAYMCASGIPDNDPNHATNAVRTGIQMRDYIESFNASLPSNAPKWDIRIGINSGPVVAGVVGIKKFAYDIWGDAVNIASRMESSGEIRKVNISQSTYTIVKDTFNTVHRGKIHAKNKGDIDMYFAELIS